MEFHDDLLGPPTKQRHGEPQPSTGRTGSASGFKWIPIRSLEARHRPSIRSHLLALDEHDRYMRFGYVANDAQIERYVDLLDFDLDEVFGVFNRQLELLAMAHLACLGPAAANSPLAEFGVSVARHFRGRGCAEHLFDRAALHARNRGIDTLLVHALSENTAMLRIARNAGARIERDGPQSQAWVRLAPESLASRVEAMVEARAAAFDYHLKQQARRLDSFVAGLTKG